MLELYQRNGLQIAALDQEHKVMHLPVKRPAKPAQRVQHRAGESPLQRMADGSAPVLQLMRLQAAANHAPATEVLQRYRTSTQSGQDGQFVPSYDAAIHCHIGNRMRSPHLKIRGARYNFGNPTRTNRIQAAYDALVSDSTHQTLEGYADCVEYLLAQGAEEHEEEAAASSSADTRPQSAYDDPATSRASRALIERGLATGRYPPVD